MNDIGSRAANRLLTSLPNEVNERLRPHLERIEAPLDMKVYEPYEKIAHVVFPLNAVASIVASTERGDTVEVGVVGCEGVAGIEVAFGCSTSPHECMIQAAGPVLRLSSKKFDEEFRRGGVFQERVLSFAQKLYSQISQTTLCNRLHHVGERLPRWLLMCDDRIAGDELLLTQDFIALMIGSSRVSVTRAATVLQDSGYIRYVRGRITILDRKGLEKEACECYKIVKRQYDRK